MSASFRTSNRNSAPANVAMHHAAHEHCVQLGGQGTGLVSVCSACPSQNCKCCECSRLVQVMTLFYIAAAVYPSLVGKKGIPTFQFIYFFSSFWGQFGPNCTTFLLAGKSSASHCDQEPAHAVMHFVLQSCAVHHSAEPCHA